MFKEEGKVWKIIKIIKSSSSDEYVGIRLHVNDSRDIRTDPDKEALVETLAKTCSDYL